MWSKLSKQLSIIAITSIMFVILMIGMSSLSQTGGGAWGFNSSMLPEEAAEEAFENGDYRILGIRLTKNSKPRQSLYLAARCWPEELNTIEYEYIIAVQKEPERGAHSMRVAYAKRYNSYISSLLSGIGKDCKFQLIDEYLPRYFLKSTSGRLHQL